jgi:hypothetical protein
MSWTSSLNVVDTEHIVSRRVKFRARAAAGVVNHARASSGDPAQQPARPQTGSSRRIRLGNRHPPVELVAQLTGSAAVSPASR